jgi:hypothetical protein
MTVVLKADGDRRDAQRMGADCHAALRRRSAPQDIIHISNISARGCRFTSRWPLGVGEQVRVILPGIEPWPATVAWFDGPEGGLHFVRPLHRSVAESFARGLEDLNGTER